MPKREIEYKGIIYKNKKELIEDYGLNYRTVIKRMSYEGLTLEECLEGRDLKRYNLDGNVFNVMKEVSYYTGISCSWLYKYKERGVSLQCHVDNIRKLRREKLK
jgi:hypothetical protein